MRTTWKQALRHPAWIPEWWLDCPWRKPRNVRTLLFEKGRGWLRWGMDDYDVADDYFEGHAISVWSCPCAPPLRRAWERVWYALATRPVMAWPGYRHPDFKERQRLPWSETKLSREDYAYYRDPEWPSGYVW